jgi:AcrR family transcriptional regulator
MSQVKAISRRRTAPARRGGRPRSADLDKLNQKILTAAGDLFVQDGFDGTSMDAIAAKARISKRTLYARHPDKWTLFNSAIYDRLGRFLVPVETVQYEPGDLNAALLAVARDMVAGVMRPEFLAVYRIVAFEGQRRPEFGRWIHDARRRPAVQTIATILQHHRDELRVNDFERAAEQFMSLTVDVGLRFGVFAIKMTPRDVQHHLEAAVDLFLNGARRHDTAEPGPNRRSTTAAA